MAQKPFLKRGVALNGDQQVSTPLISLDGKKWEPYGLYWRNLHEMLNKRSKFAQNGSLRTTSTIQTPLQAA